MLTVANGTVGCFPFVLERPVQLTKERHCSIGIQRNFPAISSKHSIQTKFWLLLRVCVCVTQNKNLCKGTAVRFSLTGSTSQREPFLKNFHSDLVSRSKFPDNSTQWKALLVCLCHLFKIRTIWGQIREPAGPICSFAEI